MVGAAALGIAASSAGQLRPGSDSGDCIDQFGSAQAAGTIADVAMTGSWGAPRDGYLLTLAIALGDIDQQNELWTTVSSAGGEIDLLVALGAQARLMARTAATATGKSFDVPASVWEGITCPDVRDFAMAAYAGGDLRKPSRPSVSCLRNAAESLARLQLAAMDMAGLPPAWLADVCARVTAAGPGPVIPPPADAEAAVEP